MYVYTGITLGQRIAHVVSVARLNRIDLYWNILCSYCV